MLKVGITGGIGSGKSTVAKIFSVLDVPVFNADDSTKWLMENDADLISAIKNHFGEAIYVDGKLQRKLLAEIVFNNQNELTWLNSVTHPATGLFFNNWFLISGDVSISILMFLYLIKTEHLVLLFFKFLLFVSKSSYYIF